MAVNFIIDFPTSLSCSSILQAMRVMLVASILFYFVYLFVFLYHYYYYSYFGFYSFCVLELVFKIFETIRGRKVSFIEDLFGRRNGVTVLSVIRMALD